MKMVMLRDIPGKRVVRDGRAMQVGDVLEVEPAMVERMRARGWEAEAQPEPEPEADTEGEED